MTVAVDTATSRVLATTDINLVTAATSLIPTLRSRSSETDALARLPGSTIAGSLAGTANRLLMLTLA
jgi:hypothetical protein